MITPKERFLQFQKWDLIMMLCQRHVQLMTVPALVLIFVQVPADVATLVLEIVIMTVVQANVEMHALAV
jgi:hypothetical protein